MALMVGLFWRPLVIVMAFLTAFMVGAYLTNKL